MTRGYTPLRYPGGKGKLAPFIKSVIEQNDLFDGEYAEPYAGGAAIALELVLQEFVKHAYINDISKPIYSFWKSVLDEPDALCKLISDTRLTISQWDRQKKIFSAADDVEDLELGFATFFLNRTNRSGILNAGVIGGRAQTGEWGIDARYNAADLTNRIHAIAKMRSRISLSKMDALKFLRTGLKKWSDRTLIYLDPPYYEKGSRLYYNSYVHSDHADLAVFVQKNFAGRKWIVSYDNVPAIRKMYIERRRITYGLRYSAWEQRQGAEVIYFADSLNAPDLVGPFQRISSRLKLSSVNREIKTRTTSVRGAITRPMARANAKR